MTFVNFNPKKHKNALRDGRLYELQHKFMRKQIVACWVRVKKKNIYEDALNNPIFFAVRTD